MRHYNLCECTCFAQWSKINHRCVGLVYPSIRYSETGKPSDIIKASGNMIIISSEQKCQKCELQQKGIYRKVLNMMGAGGLVQKSNKQSKNQTYALSSSVSYIRCLMKNSFIVH